MSDIESEDAILIPESVRNILIKDLETNEIQITSIEFPEPGIIEIGYSDPLKQTRRVNSLEMTRFVIDEDHEATAVVEIFDITRILLRDALTKDITY